MLTGNTPSQLSIFITTLDAEFEVTDLGSNNYFLGIEVSHLKDSVHFTQNKYILNLLRKSNLLKCKPISTLMSSGPLPLALTDILLLIQLFIAKLLVLFNISPSLILI